MEFLQSLPPWAAVLLALFAAVVLVGLNIGWLLQAKAMLDRYGRKPNGTKQPPKTEPPVRPPDTKPDR